MDKARKAMAFYTEALELVRMGGHPDTIRSTIAQGQDHHEKVAPDHPLRAELGQFELDLRSLLQICIQDHRATVEETP